MKRQITDYRVADMEARRARRDELIAAGGVYADPDDCGALPCGICDWCVEQGHLDLRD